MTQVPPIRDLPGEGARRDVPVGAPRTAPEIRNGPVWGGGRAAVQLGSATPVRPIMIAFGVALALTAAADLLLWQEATPRLAWAVFALALGITALLLAQVPLRSRAMVWAVSGLILGVLPVIEHVQPLSLLFLVAGLAHAAGWAFAGSNARWAVVLRGAVTLPASGFLQAIHDLFAVLRGVRNVQSGGMIARAALRDWALPLGLGLVFVLLLTAANPVLQGWADDLLSWSPALLLNPARMVFWAAILCLVWPFLRLTAIAARRVAPVVRAPKAAQILPGWLNGRSVARALILFNLIFAVQNGLDLVFLWGDSALPNGITHATYAHRGAYPLLVTALLAGAFALLAQPFLAGQKVLRILLLLWVTQNLGLVASSLLRLDLYVDAYGLTRLRFAAMVWMGLVAAGLATMLWQLAAGHRATWLFTRAAMLGLVTLYGTTFVNVDGLIARTNLADQAFKDINYLCGLGSGAAPAIAASEAASGLDLCWESDAPALPTPAQDWRDWGYRNHRLVRSLAAIAVAVPAGDIE